MNMKMYMTSSNMWFCLQTEFLSEACCAWLTPFAVYYTTGNYRNLSSLGSIWMASVAEL